jgi:hypothetical protein
LKAMVRILKSQQGIAAIATILISVLLLGVTGGLISTILRSGSSASDQVDAQVDSALSDIGSTLVTRGDIFGYNTPLNHNNSIGKIEFMVVGNSTAIDLTPPYILDGNNALVPDDAAESYVGITFENGENMIPDCAWTVSFLDKDNSDPMLTQGRKAKITVWLQDWDGAAWNTGSEPFLESAHLSGGQSFTLTMAPAKGIPLILDLTTPYRLQSVNRLK